VSNEAGTKNPVRFVTAASLFDGHDASINIMRRILQSQGAEVIHLGHDRSVDQVVRAVIQEDVQGVALSSYQGGHVEYFSYLRELLNAQGAEHVKIYGGGGGVIVPEEIATLSGRGIRIFSPEDGQRLGLVGMIKEMMDECDVDLAHELPSLDAVLAGSEPALARAITALEEGAAPDEFRTAIHDAAVRSNTPVLGITGTGGSGKSTLTDELLRRFRLDQEGKLRIAVIAVDPTRRKGGGALLGDRIRMNSVDLGSVYFRSLATRKAGSEIPENLADVINAARATHDLVIVETPGIGQGDAGIVPFCDTSLYVMTPEFGAASQLEKIDMLDFAEIVVLNKFERRGAEDALRGLEQFGNERVRFAGRVPQSAERVAGDMVLAHLGGRER
jgi:methylmalonyl-CoA mutase